ncbi:MAG: glycosyltransferase family 87 protein [Chloroflexota bacterium]
MGVLVLSADLLLGVDAHQRDFFTYYLAGLSYRLGLDPYDLAVLTGLAGGRVVHPFVYPPMTVPLFGALAALDFPVAYHVFLGIKATALAALFGVWRKSFVRGLDIGFILFGLLAYHAALYVDFRVGNVSVFEQLLMWIAFSQLIQGRASAFGGLMVLASVFKLTPILFLPLVLLVGNSRARIALLASLGVFSSALALSLLISPTLFVGFLTGLSGLDERGVVNPSVLAFWTDVAEHVSATAGVACPRMLPMGLYGLTTAGVLLISWQAGRRHLASGRPPSLVNLLYLACFVYALVLPRFKTYAFQLLLVPTYMLLTRNEQHTGAGEIGSLLRTWGLPGAFAVLSSLSLVTSFWAAQAGFLLAYAPLYAATLAWGLWILVLRSSGSPAASHTTASGALP